METKIILGIQVQQRQETAEKLQHILSAFGCVIKTRLGLNDIENEYALPGGIILLELSGDQGECQRLEDELLTLKGVELRKMTFPIQA